jgi:cytochrome c peroxidase
MGTVEEWQMQKNVRGEWVRASLAAGAAGLLLAIGLNAGVAANDERDVPHHVESGRRLFEQETFGGNGRTCVTCHSRRTGTVSPEDARERFARDPDDPLFRGDGSDDGNGNGVERMLADATVLVRVPLPDNVSLADEPTTRSVVVRRGIPSTLNGPSLDPVLMVDGRQPSLEAQARGAVVDHAGGTRMPTAKELEAIAVFERTRPFFSSRELFAFAWTGHAPALPKGRTAAEKRGRIFFEDVPFASPAQKAGLCAACHSGPMLNETNQFLPVPPMRRGGRFQSVLVSELNEAGNPVREFIFTNPDGTTSRLLSPDPGRALVTGKSTGFEDPGAFKIPTLWGVSDTAPYFHDNSARTLEDLMRHYAKFFAIVSTPPGGSAPAVVLTKEDQADIVAYLKLLR